MGLSAHVQVGQQSIFYESEVLVKILYQENRFVLTVPHSASFSYRFLFCSKSNSDFSLFCPLGPTLFLYHCSDSCVFNGLVNTTMCALYYSHQYFRAIYHFDEYLSCTRSFV